MIRSHVLICGGTGCTSSGSMVISKKLAEELKAKGLEEEVKKLKSMGCTRDMVSMQGLGYKEVLDYLNGDLSLEEAVYIIKRDTRHFAKRQLTWFKREKEVTWVTQETFAFDRERVLDWMLNDLKKRGIIE